MQKHVHVNLVDLVKSFPTNIFLQNLASIQQRTSPVKFARLAEKSEKGSISNFSTKVEAGHLSPAALNVTTQLGKAHETLQNLRRHPLFQLLELSSSNANLNKDNASLEREIAAMSADNAKLKKEDASLEHEIAALEKKLGVAPSTATRVKDTVENGLRGTGNQP